MPRLTVCPLSRLPETVASCGARHLVTLVTAGMPVTRPAAIAPDDHLLLGISDITAPLAGHVLPERAHAERLIAFVRAWNRARPLVLHCYAGVSRSPAAAYIAACALLPERDEAELARTLRAASPSATPNARLVAMADAVLGRDGRMVAAIAAIGRGADAYEGETFSLALD
ncbi:tyrosine phosphatase family protein [Methylobacterium sp. ID0610]|uniref:tyrosine phosphatase family protein n=1 Tax=Methylobacterium carpenticola TaxID=3344827 RepID=UPI003679C5B3